MRPIVLCCSLAVLGGLAFFFGMSLAPAPISMAGSLAESDEQPVASKPDQSAVLIELFTSQGCSSCPPADALLDTLASDPHRRIIPLSFHVDYWNRLGWRDPFSSAQWSERQQLYNRALRTGRVYTPQLVVDGAAHCVGSDVSVAHELIDQASRNPQPVTLSMSVERVAQTLKVMVVAQVGPVEGGQQPMVVRVALAESDLETSVKTGENARRNLHNDFVVRQLEAVLELDVDAKSGGGEVELRLDDGIDPEKVSVVAFAEETASRRIRGAAVWSPG